MTVLLLYIGLQQPTVSYFNSTTALWLTINEQTFADNNVDKW